MRVELANAPKKGIKFKDLEVNTVFWCSYSDGPAYTPDQSVYLKTKDHDSNLKNGGVELKSGIFFDYDSFKDVSCFPLEAKLVIE